MIGGPTTGISPRSRHLIPPMGTEAEGTPSLAGILMLSAWRMVQWRELGRYLRITRFDATIVCLTAISAVAVSIGEGFSMSRRIIC